MNCNALTRENSAKKFSVRKSGFRVERTKYILYVVVTGVQQ